MSDFVSGFWNIYVATLSIASILACAGLLLMQSFAKIKPGEVTGHIWDETLCEYNNPMPNWWRWLFYLTIAFGLIYLALFPGLGSYAGSDNWSATGQYDREVQTAETLYAPLFKKYAAQDVATVAADSEAREMGQRLFLTYCSQCHGSDARGGKGYPNLTDGDWLFGGSAVQIRESITLGRAAMMPAKGLKPDLNSDQIKDIAHYTRSLSGLTADSIRMQRGKELFVPACAACHGATGQGTIGVAPNLADKIWLYGESETTVIETITKGRENRMPAFGEFLGADKVHLLTAYVYGLGGGVK